MTVNLSKVADVQKITLTLTNVTSSSGKCYQHRVSINVWRATSTATRPSTHDVSLAKIRSACRDRLQLPDDGRVDGVINNGE